MIVLTEGTEHTGRINTEARRHGEDTTCACRHDRPHDNPGSPLSSACATCLQTPVLMLSRALRPLRRLMFSDRD